MTDILPRGTPAPIEPLSASGNDAEFSAAIENFRIAVAGIFGGRDPGDECDCSLCCDYADSRLPVPALIAVRAP